MGAMARGSTRRWRKVRAYVLERDRGVCHLCGLGGADTVDHHPVPVADGGTDDPANLRAAHGRCPGPAGGGNYAKGSTTTARAPRPSRSW